MSGKVAKLNCIIVWYCLKKATYKEARNKKARQTGTVIPFPIIETLNVSAHMSHIYHHIVCYVGICCITFLNRFHFVLLLMFMLEPSLFISVGTLFDDNLQFLLQSSMIRRSRGWWEGSELLWYHRWLFTCINLNQPVTLACAGAMSIQAQSLLNTHEDTLTWKKATEKGCHDCSLCTN